MESVELLSQWGYLGLFVAAFLAGSIIPFCSEAVLVVFLVAGYRAVDCLVVATLGNWLGGVTCYCIGRMGKIVWIEKYLHISRAKLDRAQRFLQGKGALMGFFGFLPGVGGIIVVALGLMRANRLWVNASMFVGKLLRYGLILWGMQALSLSF